MCIWKVVFFISIWSASNVKNIASKPTAMNISSTYELGSVTDNLSDSSLKTLYSCENNVLNIGCVEGGVMHIIRANYGRLTRNLCNDDGQVVWHGDQCMSDISYLIITDKCEQKERCSVRASNTIFGDPCYGTIKYLEVQYVCGLPSNVSSSAEQSSILNISSASKLGSVPDTTLDSRLIETAYSCENNVLHLDCMEGSVIHIIRGNYGRLTRDLCNNDGQVVWSGERCTSIGSFIIMAKRCEQKQRCSVRASNILFGDPCYGTIKYLQVQYVCVSPSNVSSTSEQPSILNGSFTSDLGSVPDITLDSRLFKTVYACEHNFLHLTCVEGSIIHIIRTNYGRLTRYICNDDGQVMWSGERCVSNRSFIAMAKRCEQKQRCSVQASNTLFGDPCYGTIKYLEVQYGCVSPSSVYRTKGKSSIFNISFASELESKPSTTLDNGLLKIAYSCGNNVLHLSCVEGSVINIIQANYGRLNRHWCNKDDQVMSSEERCVSNSSSFVIAKRCEQKERCSVRASNTIFGDPCYGTVKYLEVQYVCGLPINFTSTTENSTIFSSTAPQNLESKQVTSSPHLSTINFTSTTERFTKLTSSAPQDLESKQVTSSPRSTR